MEVLQRAAVLCLRRILGEHLLECGIALDAAFRQHRLIFEQERIHHVLGTVVDDPARGAGGVVLDLLAQLALQALLHEHGAQGGLVCLREDILRGSLVLQDHERHDVAELSWIRRGVEELFQRPGICPGLEVDRHILTFFLRRHIAAMQGVAVLARHIPAAPAV